ncbi:hypothetical protein B0H14DRAFT_2604151 [Mycena olivaceomarginata]|nr:hypothetical protein B0H14DRAFT_2604151 [Mycena olivaceomarginata]
MAAVSLQAEPGTLPMLSPQAEHRALQMLSPQALFAGVMAGVRWGKRNAGGAAHGVDVEVPSEDVSKMEDTELTELDKAMGGVSRVFNGMAAGGVLADRGRGRGRDSEPGLAAWKTRDDSCFGGGVALVRRTGSGDQGLDHVAVTLAEPTAAVSASALDACFSTKKGSNLSVMHFLVNTPWLKTKYQYLWGVLVVLSGSHIVHAVGEEGHRASHLDQKEVWIGKKFGLRT